MKILCFVALLLGLSLFCPVATANPPPASILSVPATGIPREVSMNTDAGRGNELFITVSLSNGEKLPFLIDTGASKTIIDKSLEPELGKRLSSGKIRVFGISQGVDSYYAPSLFAGNTQLMMAGPYITAYDCSGMSTNANQPVKGILGMDVLSHYCIQLDFVANKIRFLDDQHVDKSNWGKAFSLRDVGDGCFYINQNLTGAESPGSLVDTGCDYGGWLVPELYHRWTNQAPLTINGKFYTDYGVWAGEIYLQLRLRRLDSQLQQSGDLHLTLNGIGLQFLAQNVVTLDFPRQTMYLKRIAGTSSSNKDMRALAKSEKKSALKFLNNLMEKGQLPGWLKSDKMEGVATRFEYPSTVVFDHMQKKGDSSEYHYQVYRQSNDGSWELAKGWRTDASGKVIQEYTVH